MSTALETRQPQAITSPKVSAWNGMATGIYTLWLKHMRKFMGSGMEIMGTLFTPILWMLLFGLSMGSMVQNTSAMHFSISYEAYITPGIMLMTGLTAAIIGGSTLLMERINGVVKEYLVAPIPRLSVLLGTMASGLTKSMIQAIIVVILGIFLGATLVFNPLFILAGLVVVAAYSLGFVGLAAAVASQAKSTESYHALIMILNLPVLFLSNALYPLETMPVILKQLAYLNPTVYAIDATRYLFYGAPTEIGLLIDLPVLVAFMVLGVWYGFHNFQKSVANPAS
ncbi:MAG: ABC transporter permease [Chloroflexi bacterium]|nr:ABC transporter permease [Chloroflexota bacterium]